MPVNFPIIALTDYQRIVNNTDKRVVKSFVYSPFLPSILPITVPPIGTVSKSDNLIKKIATWAMTGSNPFPDTTGYISGIVKVEGVLWSNVIVRLYYEDNGFFIGYTYTDENGEFRFDELEYNVPKYTVIAYHEGFNAMVMRSVAPVLTVYTPPEEPEEPEGESIYPYTPQDGDSVDFTSTLSTYEPPDGNGINFI